MMKNLKELLVSFILTLSTGMLSAQQSKIIKGRVISEDLELLPGVKIYNVDTIALGSTNIEGCFKIDIPVDADELLFGFVGLEWINVKIENDCKNLEMIMMLDVIYDFMPTKKINKKRYKRFKQLPKKHKKAYEQGLFKSDTCCVSYIFTE